MIVRSPLVLATVLLAAACSGSDVVKPPTPPANTCSLALTAAPGVSLAGSARATLGGAEAVTLPAADLGACLTLAADGGRYVVVPQFATGSGPGSSIPFEVVAGNAPSGMVAPPLGARAAAAVPPLGLQAQLDATLRAREAQLAPAAAAAARDLAVRGNVVAAALPVVGSTRTFRVLKSLSGGTDSSAFRTDTAVLRYAGTNILIYVDQRAPAAPAGFTDAQLAAIGQQFDTELYDIDVRTFGAPSDVDQNGRVIVLMTPTVNALTPAGTCASQGYIAGFFYGLDLSLGAANSNKAEIFYSLVPDSAGTFSCAHSVAQVNRVTPATFIHEFQHMISWNQHVLVRHGGSEAVWLNEGMSHIAEEMGARYYEQKYPPPSGRSDSTLLFPDSAQGFIVGDLYNAYTYLLDPQQWSITQFLHGGSLAERGGAWLFLRWLGDQYDSTVYARLEQTSLTGVANVQNATGETLPALFGDFSLALYTDSLPGVPRDAVPARHRFRSRNLRVLFQSLYDALQRSGQGSQAPRPFPILSTVLTAPGGRASSMVPGTPGFFVVQMPATGAAESLTFDQPGGAALPTGIGAQVTVFRCPDIPGACP